MQANPFKKATKTQAKLRLGLFGASGCGKTLTGLLIAQGFGGKIALIDTEHSSAAIYADRVEFDTLDLTNFHPQQYIDAINAAAAAGYDVLVIDSLSHAWAGAGGVLEIVDNVTRRSDSKNAYSTGWRDATPIHNKLIEALLAAPMHLVVTMRSKTEYVLERNAKGKTEPRKVGVSPIQRDGMEYEFTVVGQMNAEHELIITKTRFSELDNEIIEKPGADLGRRLMAWLQDGVEAPETPAKPQQPPPPPPAPASAQNGAQNGSGEPRPNGSASSTGTSQPSGGASAKADFFPDEPPGDLGSSDKLPRDVNGFPVLGSLNMVTLLNTALSEKLVKHKNHFSNLIDLLWRDGLIRAASKPEAVMEAIRKHETEKDMQREAAGK